MQSSEDETEDGGSPVTGQAAHSGFMLYTTPDKAAVAHGVSKREVVDRYGLEASDVVGCSDQGKISKQVLMRILETKHAGMKSIIENMAAWRQEAADREQAAADRHKEKEAEMSALTKQVAALGWQFLLTQLPIIAVAIVSKALFPHKCPRPKKNKVSSNQTSPFVCSLIQAMEGEAVVALRPTLLSILGRKYPQKIAAGSKAELVTWACDRLYEHRNAECAHFHNVKLLDDMVETARTLLEAHPDMRQHQAMAVALVEHYSKLKAYL